jgi:hypothetical protein
MAMPFLLFLNQVVSGESSFSLLNRHCRKPTQDSLPLRYAWHSLKGQYLEVGHAQRSGLLVIYFVPRARPLQAY